ncbi:branched-chain amino acid ABC transporter permease [Nocardioides sp. Iso805N]|uniref:branched-chain amino acid ABC transporter permease n=1 Tax=Nocardioides sp. Iso805N TaxID=1283287 RepID=UPI000382988D|nr:branched-chain amino acid ABC transporter permease [Nocardioides sp. Iso805N]
MELFSQRLVDGLSSGCIYAALALAIVLVFRATGTLNLAQGEMAMFCCFLIWKLTDLGWPLIPAILAGVVAGFVGGAAIERVIIRPVEDSRDHLPVIIVTLGLLLALDSLAGGLFTVDTETLGSPFPSGSWHIGQVLVPYSSIGLFVVISALSGLMWFTFHRTRLGLAMRASVDNPESARLLGIRRSRMLMIGWGAAAALGALAAALVAPQTYVYTGMLQGVLLYAFTAATLGGFDSPAGAVVGGLLVGVLQTMVSGYVGFVGNDLSLMTALVVIIVVLMLKPTGLFGRPDSRRL